MIFPATTQANFSRKGTVMASMFNTPRQKESGCGTVSLGNQPDLAGWRDVVGAEDACAILDGEVVELLVVLVEVAPITSQVTVKQSQRRDAGRLQGFKCAGCADYFAKREEWDDGQSNDRLVLIVTGNQKGRLVGRFCHVASSGKSLMNLDSKLKSQKVKPAGRRLFQQTEAA